MSNIRRHTISAEAPSPDERFRIQSRLYLVQLAGYESAKTAHTTGAIESRLAQVATGGVPEAYGYVPEALAKDELARRVAATGIVPSTLQEQQIADARQAIQGA